MGRPPRFTNEQVLDAALALVNEGGPSALTVAGVASALGAPSGSIYHRFPSRDVLVAALWLRSVERFQVGLINELRRPDPTEAAIAAARHVVRWSRDDVEHARLLLVHRSRDLLGDQWPEDIRDRNRAQRRRIDQAMETLFSRLGARDDVARRRVMFAVVDIPYGAVRRPLVAGRVPDPELEDLVAEAAAATLSHLPSTGGTHAPQQ